MNKKLDKTHADNARLDTLSSPFDAPPGVPFIGADKNVIIIAKLTDDQYNSLVGCLLRPKKNYIRQ